MTLPARLAPRPRPAMTEAHLLLIESDLAYARFLCDALASDPMSRIAVTAVTSLGHARAPLDTQAFDLLLLDVVLPDGGGLEWIADLARHRDLPPVIMLAGVADEPRALDAVHAGADDYLVKSPSDPRAVARTIASAIELDRARRQLQRDVTRRQEAETALRQHDDQLRQAQKMEAIGRLAGGVAHDFSNLLTIILGASERLLERLPAGDALRKDVDSIRSSADRAAAMTQQLLAFSRQRVLAPSVLNLNDVLAGTERFLRPLIGENIELRTHCARDLGSVRADRTQIEQVLLNLAINARDAMPEGGRLTIETEEVGAEDIPPDVPLEPGRYVLTTVTDTGIGMDAETQAHAFEPFFTTKETGKGTGLGLATVYGIVKQSGGFITIRSVPGTGTRVMFYLPRIDDAATVRSETAAAAAAPRGSETVLLVEDEAGVRELAREMLELVGYEVLDADHPREAERICREFTGPIHLLLTDVVMPEMNGQELARRVLTLRPATRVLFMSGYPEQTASGSVLSPGIHFIAKPFERRALLQRVRSVLDASV